ncbi:hypothetical protein [Caballeronia sordidicola]
MSRCTCRRWQLLPPCCRGG